MNLENEKKYSRTDTYGPWTIYTGEAITDEMFEEMLLLNRKIFPIGSGYELEFDYIRKIFNNTREGLFIIRDINNDEIVSFFFNIFVTNDQAQKYLNHEYDYRNLDNIGFQPGDNTMYLYSIGVDEHYRQSMAVRMMLKEFCLWVYSQKQKGKNIDFAFGEAVSYGGYNVAMNLLGMDTIDGQSYGPNGEGFYCCYDNFEGIINDMLEFEYGQFYAICPDRGIPVRR